MLMDFTYYSNFLLDADGNFTPQKFLQAFCEIAYREHRQYPGITNRRVDHTSTSSTSSNNISDTSHQNIVEPPGVVVNRHPVVNTASATTSPYTPNHNNIQTHVVSSLSSKPSTIANATPTTNKEEQLEAISDDEEEEDNNNNNNNNTIVVSPSTSKPLLYSQFQPPSLSSSSFSSTSLPTSTPWASTPSESISEFSWIQKDITKQERSNRIQTIIQHRLKLVLDLDNTLLHACARSKIGNCDIKLHHFVDPDGQPEMYKFVLPQILNQIYYVKLRPGLRRFLREVAEYCDLAIHTNATREYADVIVAILDPDRSLFRGRIAAREDETAKDHKKNMDRLFGIDDLDIRSLVILDDRKDVWDETFQPNIIQCGMYDYLDSRKHPLVEKYLPTLPEDPQPQASTCAEASLVNPQSLTTWGPSGLGVPGTVAALNSNSNITVRENANCYDNEVSPFLDNPLVGTSDNTTTGSDDDDCEDDDLITSADVYTNRITETTASDDEGILSIKPNSGASSPSSGLSGTDEALVDYDTQLDWLRELIIGVAKEFNTRKTDTVGDEVSVSRLLSDRRRQILKDVVVQTVGMYKSETSHPEHGWHDNGPMHRRRLVSLGAQVVETSVPELTHILAMRATQTIDRVKKERGDEVKYVHALWLHACESTWSRVCEDWFQAAPLLKKYDYNPPKKPWLDHWRVAALANPEKSVERVQLALTLLNDSNAQMENELKIRDHLVTGSYSSGAQVWSASEHVFLKFDPIESNRLKLELQSKPDTVMINSQHQQPFNLNTQRPRHTGSSQGITQQEMTQWEDYESSMAGHLDYGPRRKRQRQDIHELSSPSNEWDYMGRYLSQPQRWRNGDAIMGGNPSHVSAPENDLGWGTVRNRQRQRGDYDAWNDWGVPKSEPSNEGSPTNRKGNILGSSQYNGEPPYHNHSMFFSNSHSTSNPRTTSEQASSLVSQ